MPLTSTNRVKLAASPTWQNVSSGSPRIGLISALPSWSSRLQSSAPACSMQTWASSVRLPWSIRRIASPKSSLNRSLQPVHHLRQYHLRPCCQAAETSESGSLVSDVDLSSRCFRDQQENSWARVRHAFRLRPLGHHTYGYEPSASGAAHLALIHRAQMTTSSFRGNSVRPYR